MNFCVNKTPAEIIKEGTFGGTYFREIYSGVNGKWYRKQFNKLEDIDHKYYCSIYFEEC